MYKSIVSQEVFFIILYVTIKQKTLQLLHTMNAGAVPVPTLHRRNSRETWETCCSKTNADFIKYIVQVTFGLIVLIFSMAMITMEIGNREIWYSSITMVVGLFFPHPSMQTRSVITTIPSEQPRVAGQPMEGQRRPDT